MEVQRKRVLIVEDDPAVRQIVRVLLERDGIEVDVAEDGERATQLLASRDYAAVLLDLLLPRLDGHGVVAFMKERGIAAPVVVVTAVADSHDLDPDVVRVVMQKPFEARELRKVVSAVLERV
ncbi:MAG: response regulator [Acidobacteriota bacterium]|nr:response regulator [Acidobacteriota bacterium]